MRKIIVPVLLAVCSAFVPASAETVFQPGTNIQFVVPAPLLVVRDREAIQVRDKAGEFIINFLIADSGDLAKATARLDRGISKIVTRVTWSNKGKEISLNGMKAFSIDGRGTISGKSVDLGVLLIKTGSKTNDSIVLVMAETAAMNKNGAVIRQVISSMKPKP